MSGEQGTAVETKPSVVQGYVSTEVTPKSAPRDPRDPRDPRSSNVATHPKRVRETGFEDPFADSCKFNLDLWDES